MAEIQSSGIKVTRHGEHEWTRFNSDAELAPFHLDAAPDAYAYLVVWEAGAGSIVKAGITSRPARWRSFVRRGARVDTIVRSHPRLCLDIEAAALDAAAVFHPAFGHKLDSLRYLGGNGEGWTECYTADVAFVRRAFERALI